ncbi:TesB-like acyl-CoA thioesterase 1 [Rhodococcus sp. WMMA185]|uniref:acyl-CoA thioesterase domain-containing protein n=1 Tax=Rhodococcus sp. WMMA185 TaxID=679318 RepID=UPI000878907D|nr:acyl-CoA thioesterase domain-containing protein [Rhodococcus sp. WMMA185]AOW91797.1 TesB-like acyl-CoA thioesterase 1 [Rhodococcus sp. WMMA185]
MIPSTTTAFPSEFDSSWLGFGGLHGGLVVASMLHATSIETTATPVALTAHLTRPVEPGPVEVRADLEHGGRTPSVRASIADSASALVRLTRDTSGDARSWSASTSDIDDVNPEQLSPLEIPVDFVPFSQYLDIRPINAARPFAGGADPEFEVWIRLLSSIEFTPQERAAVLLDALPPGLFATLDRAVAIPTVEFSAYFPPVSASRPPADEIQTPLDEQWHHLRHRTVWATDELCVDESELRTSTGRLAGQARQLRRILPS